MTNPSKKSHNISASLDEPASERKSTRTSSNQKQILASSLFNGIEQGIARIDQRRFLLCCRALSGNNQIIETKSTLINKNNNSINFFLFQKCAEESPDKNIIISPHSVASALALLSQGARENTFKQIVRVLHLESDKETIAAEYEKHYSLLKEAVGQSTLSIANQIYVEQGFQLKQAFRDVAVKKFKSNVDSLDFSKSVAAAQTINSFVESKTNNKIKNLIDPDSLDVNTRLVLVNAIYFKGDWKQKFALSNTSPGDFYVNEIKTVKVDFMRIKDRFQFANLVDLDASALELKYAQSNISFVAILPNNVTGLSALEASLINYDLSKVIGQLLSKMVDVTLPKFKTEYEIELNDVLQKVGIRVFANDFIQNE